MTKKFIFEEQTCGRCGGSGSYSYCSMYGSRCFGCGGKGVKLTKRGAAAQRFFTELASKPASEFKPGELIRMSNVTTGGDTYTAFETVVSVAPAGDKFQAFSNGVRVGQDALEIVTTRKGCESSTFTSPTTMYRRGLTGEEKQALVAKALAYQETLTKLGKPRKEKS